MKALTLRATNVAPIWADPERQLAAGLISGGKPQQSSPNLLLSWTASPQDPRLSGQ
jgi:hypothetical protein